MLGKRVAQYITLHILSMYLGRKDRHDRSNLPWNEIIFSGGNIAKHDTTT
jgi:hypothetical protein